MVFFPTFLQHHEHISTVIFTQFLSHTRTALLELSRESKKQPVVIIDELQTLLRVAATTGGTSIAPQSAATILQSLNYLVATASIDDASAHVLLVGDSTIVGAYSFAGAHLILRCQHAAHVRVQPFGVLVCVAMMLVLLLCFTMLSVCVCCKDR